MEKIYFNHSRLINVEPPIAPFIIEISQLKKKLDNNNIPLHVYAHFWQIPVRSPGTPGTLTLYDYLNKSTSHDEAITLVQILTNNGPHFSYISSFDGLTILPVIPPGEDSIFARDLMNICLGHGQGFVLSLVDEKILSQEKYGVSARGKANLEIFNFIGKENLSNFLYTPPVFNDIAGVFDAVEKKLKSICILESAWRSARRHDFKKTLRIVYHALLALEQEMDRLIQGIPEEKRIKNFNEETGCKISKESGKVGGNRKYRKYREFYIKESEGKEYFEWHIKVGLDTRIHYFIDKEKREIYIGHCGGHLPLPS